VQALKKKEREGDMKLVFAPKSLQNLALLLKKKEREGI
jgi:hypothetical protein